MIKKTIFLSLTGMALCGIALGQDNDVASHGISVAITPFAILDIEGPTGNSLLFELDAPNEAGLPFGGTSTNETLWLNYSVIKSTSASPSQKITVAIDEVPVGFTIKLDTEAPTTTNSGGALGTGAVNLTLSTTAQNVITGIGSAYTGDGIQNGHRLSYTLVATPNADYRNINSTPQEFSVTYTISDAI